LGRKKSAKYSPSGWCFGGQEGREEKEEEGWREEEEGGRRGWR